MLVKFHVFPAGAIAFTHPSQRLPAIKCEVIILLENTACKMLFSPCRWPSALEPVLVPFYKLNIVASVITKAAMHTLPQLTCKLFHAN